jgi:hypothetical protein
MNSKQNFTSEYRAQLNLTQPNNVMRVSITGSNTSEGKKQISNFLQGKVRYQANPSGSSSNQSQSQSQTGQSHSTQNLNVTGTQELIYSDSYFEGKEPCGWISFYEIPQSLSLQGNEESRVAA